VLNSNNKNIKMYKHYTCDDCDADFKVKHELDESYYDVNFCPFCGAQIDGEEEDPEDNE